MIAAKCTLAARVDSFHESADVSLGQQLRNELEKKLEKWQEPPPVKEAKALPRPDDAPRKKRGGRRVRKMKEKFAITEMRRQANRLEFGKIGEDVYQTDLGFSVGTLGRKETGRVRNPVVDKKTQVSISKRLQVGTEISQIIQLVRRNYMSLGFQNELFFDELICYLALIQVVIP